MDVYILWEYFLKNRCADVLLGKPTGRSGRRKGIKNIVIANFARPQDQLKPRKQAELVLTSSLGLRGEVSEFRTNAGNGSCIVSRLGPSLTVMSRDT